MLSSLDGGQRVFYQYSLEFEFSINNDININIFLIGRFIAYCKQMEPSLTPHRCSGLEGIDLTQFQVRFVS